METAGFNVIGGDPMTLRVAGLMMMMQNIEMLTEVASYTYLMGSENEKDTKFTVRLHQEKLHYGLRER